MSRKEQICKELVILRAHTVSLVTLTKSQFQLKGLTAFDSLSGQALYCHGVNTMAGVHFQQWEFAGWSYISVSQEVESLDHKWALSKEPSKQQHYLGKSIQIPKP